MRAEEKSTSDVDSGRDGWRSIARFIVVFLAGGSVFLFPIQWGSQVMIPLDVILMLIQNASIAVVELFVLGIIIVEGVLMTIANVHYRGTPAFGQQAIDRLELEC